MTGTIYRLNEKRYGFITVPNQKRQIFFHKSALQNVDWEELKEGQSVTFEIEEGERGPQAVRVCVP